MLNRLNITACPPAKFGVWARLWRTEAARAAEVPSTGEARAQVTPERSVLEYVSTGAQPKRSPNPKSAGVPTDSQTV